MTYDPERDTFAHEEWTVKPVQRPGSLLLPSLTLHAGDVIRMNEWSAFPDSVILGFNKYGDAKVSRPYAYVSSAGTTGPTVLLGAETYVVGVTDIYDHYKMLENGGDRRT